MLKIAELCVNLHPNLNIFIRMRPIKSICMMLLSLVLTTSCLSSGSEATLYSDAAISSFSLGTLKRYVHTKTSTGKDTVYLRTLNGSQYKFKIDQVNHLIYNTDSLPTGTDVAHVVCTITSASNGLVTIKDVDSDTIRVYKSTDSIDFSTPREFIVHASDGSGFTKYMVNVNAHKEEPYTLTWQRMDGTPLPEPESYSLPMAGIKQIIGSCSTETYALSEDDQLMVWRDKDERWEVDLLDESETLLPTQDFALAYYPMFLADETEYVVLIGNRSTEMFPQESTARVWRKIVDSGQYAPKSHWTYMEHTDNSRLALPRLQNLAMVYYDDGLLALGGAGIGGAIQTPWYQFYQSRDNGITWKYNKNYQLPADFDYNATKVVMSVDTDDYIWLFCEGTGQVWRGQLNHMGWQVEEQR